MKIDVGILIIGAGYAGLLTQKRLRSIGYEDSIIVERGFNHGYGDKDYVVLCKSQYPYTSEPINVVIIKEGSGSGDFQQEYNRKVYHIESHPAQISYQTSQCLQYPIDNEELLRGVKSYGNIEITSIDIIARKAYGRVLHLNKNVEFNYDRLVSTIPVHDFQKLINADFRKQFDLFVSYFPIGIKKRIMLEPQDGMIIRYVSDPEIPYYRKQIHGRAVFYEYCINRSMNQKFDRVILPGKFLNQPMEVMKSFYEYFLDRNVFFIGRFALWNADFLLDHIWNPDEKLLFSNYIEELFNVH
jgi:hypothetical protein